MTLAPLFTEGAAVLLARTSQARFDYIVRVLCRPATAMSNALGIVWSLGVDEILVDVGMLSEQLIEVDRFWSMSAWPERKRKPKPACLQDKH
jgi:hypothetical protein